MKKFKDRPFALIGINLNGYDAKKLKEVLVEKDLPWRCFADPGSLGNGPITRRWNVSATPTLYLLDHKGVILRKWAGSPGEKAIDEALDAAILEAEKEKAK